MTEVTDEVYTSPTNDWMQTYSGQAFFPNDMSRSEIVVADIAHALSMQCRYNGHVRQFYSVAEHCVLMSYAVPPEDALWALLHDATEAYVGDLVRPVKKHLPDFVRIENAIMRKIVDQFDLGSYEMPASVKEADNRIIENERRALLADSPLPWTVHGEPLENIRIYAWIPAQAEMQYKIRLDELLAARAEQRGEDY